MGSKPDILVFIDWFVPGFKAGGPIRSCLNMMNHLQEFNFYVVCSDKDYMEDNPHPNIVYGDWNKIDDNINVRYLKAEEQNKEVYRSLIDAGKFAHIYVNGIYSKKFSILPLKVASESGNSTIVCVRGMLKDSAIAVKKIKKTLFLRYAKLTGLYNDITFHVTNAEEEKDVFKRIGESAHVMIAPNLPKMSKSDNIKIPTKKANHLRIVSLARVAPEKNLKFALEVLSAVKTDGNIDFDLFGSKYDASYWNECKTIIDALPANIKVMYKGVVHPDEIEETLFDYHLLFLPTKGENFGHVVIESISSGTPVLLSDQTPWNYIDQLGIGFIHSLNNRDAFIKTIEELTIKGQDWMNDMNKECLAFTKKYTEDQDGLALNKKLFLRHG